MIDKKEEKKEIHLEAPKEAPKVVPAPRTVEAPKIPTKEFFFFTGKVPKPAYDGKETVLLSPRRFVLLPRNIALRIPGLIKKNPPPEVRKQFEEAEKMAAKEAATAKPNPKPKEDEGGKLPFPKTVKEGDKRFVRKGGKMVPMKMKKK